MTPSDRMTPSDHSNDHSNDRARPDEERVGATERTLYFFPEDKVTESRLREILASGDRAERCWAISHLLRFAQWDDIWLYVSREEVRELFHEIELPENLRAAWARMLKIEAPVG